jgi:hypothetical protein
MRNSELKEGCLATGSAPHENPSRPLRAASMFQNQFYIAHSRPSDIRNQIPLIGPRGP